MGRSKIIYGGEVLLDLTADTIEPGKVLLGFKYHGPGRRAAHRHLHV